MLSHPGALLQMRTQIHQWLGEFDALMQRVGHHFGRVEARVRTSEYVQGLLSPIERKNGWQLSEQCGDETPYGIQHLLNRAKWSADDLRDEFRSYVVEQIKDREAVLVIDETGFLKKWTVIALSIAEIRRLLWHLGWELKKSMLFRLHWSMWRRRHQTIAQFYHYKRR